ncbi:MAG: hypothetical protein OEZ10_03750 [Gammaproteobacteria bacterium]|nr:hypothetical protein [Gammaproteobacteria bacterium]
MDKGNMDQSSTYALWLLPDAGETTVLQLAMDRINEAVPGPQFQPHLTLIERIHGDEDELKQRVVSLAGQMSSFTAEPEKLVHSQSYFRAVYVRLKPSADMLRCRQLGAETFKLRLDKSYQPHISLLYSAMPRYKKLSALDPVHLSLPSDYNLNRLALVRIALSVSDWEIICEASLS